MTRRQKIRESRSNPAAEEQRTTAPGGYLGVDMFFVLRRYVLNAINWRAARAGHFSVVRYYGRRARKASPGVWLGAMVAAVDDLISRLERAGKFVVLTGPIATPRSDVASIVGRQMAFHGVSERRTSVDLADFVPRFGDVLNHFGGACGYGCARPDRARCVAAHCKFLITGSPCLPTATT